MGCHTMLLSPQWESVGNTTAPTINKYVEDYQAELCPNLERGEDDSKFRQTMKIRTKEEIFKKLDLYFRTHWYTFNGVLNKYSTGNMNNSVIMERRKALEWIIDNNLDWDEGVSKKRT